MQYAGDFLEAHELRERTGQETYYAHGYVLDTLALLQRELGEVLMLSCLSGRSYDAVLPSGVRVVGAATDPGPGARQVLQHLEEFGATHVVLLSPLPRLLDRLVSRDLRVLCVLADSFEQRTLKHRVRNWRIARRFNHHRVEWVADHGRNACASLRAIGVRGDKVVPWDWPQRRRPADLKARTRSGDEAIELFLAGTLSRPKGVYDAVEALHLLAGRGLDVTLAMAGTGQVEELRALAVRLGVARQVHFLGRVPNNEVFALMQRASAVLVPSHHDYPEGLPLTIYEALAARTPIVASDHPMFAGVLRDGDTALVYPAGRPDLLADRVAQLHQDTDLYARLSAASQEAWDSIQIPVTWGDLVYRWSRDDEDDCAWLRGHAIG